MKKIFKRTVLAGIILSLIVISIFSAFADTTYVVDGYSYSVIDNISISLRGWDTSIDDTLTLPDMLANRYFTEVGNWAMENRDDLKGVDLTNAKHLKRIGYESFINCSEIENDLIIPESVTDLSERSFSGCSSIPSITIEGDVAVIPVQCFYDCSSVTSVVLPDSVQTIQAWAFGNCTALEYVEIPKSVTSIASSAFSNDPNLVLGVYTDTAGHNYAVEKNMPYILLDGPKTGDVNGDGNVDILDSTEIQKFAAEMIELTDEQFELADINNDGFVDVIDALLVQKYVVGKFDIPPIIYYT